MTSIRQSVNLFRTQVSIYDPQSEFQVTSNDGIELILSQIPLSVDLIDWYKIAAPSRVILRCTADELVFYNPAVLVPAQTGYRWDLNRNSLDSWDKTWTVIGNIGDDPVIAHTDKLGTPISMAVHGIGYWEPKPVSEGLATFLESLSIWFDVINGFGGISKSIENFDLSDAVKHSLRKRLSVVLNSDYVENLLDFL